MSIEMQAAILVFVLAFAQFVNAVNQGNKGNTGTMLAGFLFASYSTYVGLSLAGVI